MRLGYCLAALILLFPMVSDSSVRLKFSADTDGNSCEIVNPGLYQPVSVYVLVDAWVDQVTGIRFAAPLPAGSGLTHVGDTSPTFSVIGNSQSDVTVAFGTCQSGTFVALQMNFYQTSAGVECTPYGAQTGAIYTDCYFGEYQLDQMESAVLSSTGHCNPRPIHDISPADGTLIPPVMVSLSWKNGYYTCNAPLAAAQAPADDSAQLYFGASSSPPLVGYVTSPYSPGDLDPGTQYYWKLVTEYPPLETPVMTFRTMVIDATRQSTWGAIKALYR